MNTVHKVTKNCYRVHFQFCEGAFRCPITSGSVYAVQNQGSSYGILQHLWDHTLPARPVPPGSLDCHQLQIETREYLQPWAFWRDDFTDLPARVIRMLKHFITSAPHKQGVINTSNTGTSTRVIIFTLTVIENHGSIMHCLSAAFQKQPFKVSYRDIAELTILQEATISYRRVSHGQRGTKQCRQEKNVYACLRKNSWSLVWDRHVAYY
jgi:hypothetical protein